jgi:hypothetical protein
MKNRWLLNLALALLVLALALLVFLRPGREAPKPPLTALKPEAITHIVIERGRDRIALERQGESWRMSAPVSARANRFNVEGLLRLAGASRESQLGAVTGLAEYGLEAPAVKIAFGSEIVALGGLHPLRNQMYALHRGEVFLIDARLQAAALYPYDRFLDTRLFDESFRPVGFRLPGFRLTLKDGGWQREPAVRELSSDRINDFVQEWRNASALSVERAERKPPLAVIEIDVERDGRAEKLLLEVRAHEPEFVLVRRDEGLAYHFPEETGKRLLNLSEK